MKSFIQELLKEPLIPGQGKAGVVIEFPESNGPQDICVKYHFQY
jgi:hypothetical protein